LQLERGFPIILYFLVRFIEKCFQAIVSEFWDLFLVNSTATFFVVFPVWGEGIIKNYWILSLELTSIPLISTASYIVGNRKASCPQL
jgi:hypothetical protein